ncbi:MAG: hypothetical protein HZA61_15530 [Candidatus Eisenbacteria bacterium]|uniref:Alginate export domain-containing protein n=1 Tax=Eiseniibacteriota bacterium TaxID=2212470 RepID=A0A933SGI5_UNCEI|nr:hypothetical protein [Candidatus Eisenbacteria bacterium]
MRHLRNRLAVAAALALLVPAGAMASSARIAGLNVSGDYVKGDYTGMYTFLSEVNGVGNLAYVEAGSTERAYGDHAVGAVLPGLFDGRMGVWSFHLRQEHPALGQSGIGELLGPDFEDTNWNNSGEAFDVIWGHRMGSGNLGLRLNRSFESYDDGNTVVEGNGGNGRNVLGLGAGYDFEWADKGTVQFSGLYQSRHYKNSATDQSDNGKALQLTARMLHKFGGNATLIPVVKYAVLDQARIAGTADVTDKYTQFQAGLAGNWTVGSGDLLVFGAQFAHNKLELNTSDITENYAPNVFLALETQLNPWLSFRAGAQNVMFYSLTAESGANQTETKGHEFSFNLGTSVKLGSLMFDATLDPAFLQNPFAQLSGGQNAFYWGGYADRATGNAGAVAFPKVTATYTW